MVVGKVVVNMYNKPNVRLSKQAIALIKQQQLKMSEFGFPNRSNAKSLSHPQMSSVLKRIKSSILDVDTEITVMSLAIISQYHQQICPYQPVIAKVLERALAYQRGHLTHLRSQYRAWFL